MTDLILAREPQEITAGDTVQFYATVNTSLYPLASGWTVTADVVGSGGVITNVAATESDSRYLVTLSATATAALTAGTYSLVITVSSGADRYTLFNNSLNVKANLAAATAAIDTRSHAQITLDAIEAVLENRATKDQESYTIKDRSLTRMSIEDLLKFRSFYRAEVKSDERAERIAQGLGTRSKIKVRMP